MGVYHNYDVICPVCDHRTEAALVNSVNVARFPAFKAKVLDRTLNRVRCPKCGHYFIVEKPFFYSDFKDKRFVAVYPRKERHFHERASEQAADVFGAFTKLRYGDASKSRVVFGLEELREKIVAADAEIDDQILELLKLYVIQEHPFLIDKKRMRITLNGVDRERLEFYCTFDLERNYFKAYVPRTFLGTLRGTTPDQMADAPYHRALDLASKAFPKKSKAPWVNLWTLNPSNDALKTLSEVGEGLRAGKSLDPEDPAFKKMLKTLPSGNQLPAWAKRDLQAVFEFARDVNRSDIEERVFEIRFGFDIESDWFKNSDQDDTKALWTLLKDLPDIAVEGNTWIKAIYLDEDQDGGLYDPSTKEIHIGSMIESGTNAFRNVVLHEVGHAVQEKFDTQKKMLITKWLEKNFGWQLFDPNSTGIDAWINMMGGYPPQTLGKTRTEVRAFIAQSVGQGGSFNAPKIVNGPAGHLWNNPKFGPRSAFEKARSNWFTHCDKWHRSGTKRFFVNYYYQQLMVVDTATIDLIVKSMPDRYAAMSHFEFFAELFAWYYDSKAEKREAIPPFAATWFSQNVGPLDLSSPFAPSRPPPSARSPRGRSRQRA